MNTVVHRSPMRALLLMLLVCGLLYSAKFNNAFVIDDIAMIEQGDSIQHLGNIPQFWGSHAMAVNDATDGAVSSFRPIALTTIALDYAVWGPRPFGFHLTNLLLHLVAGALVWWVAGLLLGTQRYVARLAAAAVFVVHPAIGEAHVWINGRSDVLGMIFGLIGLIATDRAARTPGPKSAVWSLGVAVAFALACLSKETALFFGPVYAVHVAVVALSLRDRGERSRAALGRGAIALAAGAAAGVAFLAVRSRVLDGLAAGSGNDALIGLHNLGLLMGDGLLQLLLPTRPEMRVLAGEYGQLPPVVFPIAWSIALLALLGAGWAGRRYPPLWYAAAAWLFALAPIGVISAVQWPGFGRYLYMPAAFVLIAVVGAIDRWAQRRGAQLSDRPRRWLAGAAVAWFTLLAVVLQLQIHIYSNVDTFLTAIHARNADAWLVYAPLGRLRAEQGRLDEAIPMLQRAVELNPADEEPRVNLANAWLSAGVFAEAHASAAAALEFFPHRGELYNIQAAALADSDPEAAVRALLRCIERAPAYPRCPENLEMLVTRHPRAAEFRAIRDRLTAAPPR